MENLKISATEGICNAYFFKPEASHHSAFPMILLYMDAFGPRPALFGIAERLKMNGYAVLIPDLFYRFGNYAAFDPKTAFNPGPDRERIMGMISSLSFASVKADTLSILDALKADHHIDLTRLGTLGYCMGGKYALSSAAFFPDIVKAAASIHGGGLVTDQPESPHQLAGKIKGRVYVGVAANDRSFTVENRLVLEKAFTDSGTDALTEVYPDALHGFAVSDMAVYHPEASEKHWQRILNLFNETLM